MIGWEVGVSVGPGKSHSQGYFAGFEPSSRGHFTDNDVTGSTIPGAEAKVFAGYYSGTPEGFLDANGAELGIGTFSIAVMKGPDAWGATVGRGVDFNPFKNVANFQLNLDQGKLPWPQSFTPARAFTWRTAKGILVPRGLL